MQVDTLQKIRNGSINRGKSLTNETLNAPYSSNNLESILKKSLKYILFELISLRHQIFFAKTLIQFWVLYSFLTSQVNQLSQTSKAITDLISSFIFLSVISQK